MERTAQQMTAEEFAAVSSECSGWLEKSLETVRAILVDGASWSEVAERQGVSIQHARVLVGRFKTKARLKRLRDFTAREPPATQLTAYKIEIQALRDKGYSVHQITAYLAEQGVDVPASTIETFLRSNRA